MGRKRTRVSYARYIKKLWKLTGEIGTQANLDPRYSLVYERISFALDAAEDAGLVRYPPEDD